MKAKSIAMWITKVDLIFLREALEREEAHYLSLHLDKSEAFAHVSKLLARVRGAIAKMEVE